MNSTPQTDNCFLRSDHPHVGQQCGEALKRYLGERGYAKQTVGRYLSCTAHFFRWVERSRLDVRRINEKAIDHFLDDHLSHCDCGWSTRSDRGESHAALGHLLLVLRTLGMAEAWPARCNQRRHGVPRAVSGVYSDFRNSMIAS